MHDPALGTHDLARVVRGLVLIMHGPAFFVKQIILDMGGRDVCVKYYLLMVNFSFLGPLETSIRAGWPAF